MPDQTKTVKLLRPVEIKGRRVEEVVVREPKVKDELAAIRASDGNKRMEDAMLLGILTGLGSDGIGEIRSVDYRRIERAALDFLSPAAAAAAESDASAN